MTHEWARVAGRAVATFFAGWFGPWAAAGANALITGYEVWLAGGSSNDIHKAAAISFATSMAFNFVGRGVSAVNANYGAGAATAFKIVGHAAVGCASAEASGGSCQSGAISAGFGAGTTVITNGSFFLTVVAGGIGAELGGGKFANGALTASMGYMFNNGFSAAMRGAQYGRSIGCAAGPLGCGVGAVIGGVAGLLIGNALTSDNASNSGVVPETPPQIPSGWDGKTPPQEGWEWRGPDEPGGSKGGWVSPDGSQSLHPDPNHPPPVGSHVDWNSPKGGRWRIFPDGTVKPK
jgi:Bacterial toxin 37